MRWLNRNKHILSKHLHMNHFWENKETFTEKQFSYSKMIPWELIMIILMMATFYCKENLGRLVTKTILYSQQPILIAMKKYFRYRFKTNSFQAFILTRYQRNCFWNTKDGWPLKLTDCKNDLYWIRLWNFKIFEWILVWNFQIMLVGYGLIGVVFI